MGKCRVNWQHCRHFSEVEALITNQRKGIRTIRFLLHVARLGMCPRGAEYIILFVCDTAPSLRIHQIFKQLLFIMSLCITMC